MTLLAAKSSSSRSCKACSKAKRKCDKRSPACWRCTIKKQSCTYPLVKPTSFIRLQTPVESPLAPQLESESPHYPAGPFADLPGGPVLEWGVFDNELDLSALLATPIGADMQLTTTQSTVGGHCGAWFLAPETWVVDHTPIPVPSNFEISDLKSVYLLIQEWLKTWITTGSNVFIHAKLYRDKFPSCVQAAYTTLSAYTNRIPENTDMILRIVNEQAKNLVATIKSTPQHSLDVFGHLANVQALFVYQVIGLFDGDITSRYIAEGQKPFFLQLLTEMLEHASINLPQSLVFDQTTPSSTVESKSLWWAWVISESVRRTWLVGTGFNATYDELKQGWMPCGGDIPFTSCDGLWTAPSANVWGNICSRRDVRFIRRVYAAWMFDDAASGEEVDAFGKTMLKATYGKDIEN